MAMENIAPCSEFLMVIANLESENMIANINGINRASTLISGGVLPEPVLLDRLIAGLASNQSKFQHDIAIKMAVHSTLISIREAVMRNMDMDPSVRQDTMQTILCHLMDETFRRVQRHGTMVRLWRAQEQVTAVNVICLFLRRALVDITDARCVAAFTSLMLSPHTDVVHACLDVLLRLPPVLAGFIFAVTRAYCCQLPELPQEVIALQIGTVVGMLDRLKHISMTMVDHPEFNNLAIDVQQALKCRNLVVQWKVLNMVVSLLSPLNVDDVLRLLRTELDVVSYVDGVAPQYWQMLEMSIIECNSAYPASIMPCIQDPKYSVYVDCIDHIKVIVEKNPVLRKELLMGLLRAVRHVKSLPVCAATVWAISVSCLSLSDIRCAILAIARQFNNMLERRKIEKLMIEMQRGYTPSSDDHCSAKQLEDAEGKQEQQPCLTDMQELLLVQLGLRQQADGSYSIVMSSESSGGAEYEFLFVPSRIEPTDNLRRLVESGDALLADFVLDVLTRLAEIGQVEYF